MRILFNVLSVALGLCLLSGGCSNGDLARVHGKVTLDDGAPVANATVVFENSATNVSASGTTADDGTYELMSLKPGDGAPPGNYAVTVHHPMPADSSQVQGPRLFPPWYERPDTSGLTYEVKRGRNEFDIPLQRK